MAIITWSTKTSLSSDMDALRAAVSFELEFILLSKTKKDIHYV